MDNIKANTIVDFEDEYNKNVENEKRQVNLKDKLDNINSLIQSIPENDSVIFKANEFYQNNSDSINKNLETQRMLEECLENNSKFFPSIGSQKLIDLDKKKIRNANINININNYRKDRSGYLEDELETQKRYYEFKLKRETFRNMDILNAQKQKASFYIEYLEGLVSYFKNQASMQYERCLMIVNDNESKKIQDEYRFEDLIKYNDEGIEFKKGSKSNQEALINLLMAELGTERRIKNYYMNLFNQKISALSLAPLAELIIKYNKVLYQIMLNNFVFEKKLQLKALEFLTKHNTHPSFHLFENVKYRDNLTLFKENNESKISVSPGKSLSSKKKSQLKNKISNLSNEMEIVDEFDENDIEKIRRRKRIANEKKDSNENNHDAPNQNDEKDLYSKFDVTPFVGKEQKNEINNISKTQKQKYEKNYFGKKQSVNQLKSPELPSKLENTKKIKKEEINPNFSFPEELIIKINKE